MDKANDAFESFSALLAGYSAERERAKELQAKYEALLQTNTELMRAHESLSANQATIEASATQKSLATSIALESAKLSNDRLSSLLREANDRLALAGQSPACSDHGEADRTPLLIAVHAALALQQANNEQKARYLRSRGWEGIFNAPGIFRDARFGKTDPLPLGIAITVQARRDIEAFTHLLTVPPVRHEGSTPENGEEMIDAEFIAEANAVLSL